MNSFWRLSILSGTSVSAYFFGKYQGRTDSNKDSWDGPGISVIPKVHARSPVVEDSSLPTPYTNTSDTKKVVSEREEVPVAVRVSEVRLIGSCSDTEVKLF